MLRFHSGIAHGRTSLPTDLRLPQLHRVGIDRSRRSRPQLSRQPVADRFEMSIAFPITLLRAPSALRCSLLLQGVSATMASADSLTLLSVRVSLGQCCFFPNAPSGSTSVGLVWFGLRRPSPARPRTAASLPVRVPTVVGLPPALSVYALRLRPRSSATVDHTTSGGLLSSRETQHLPGTLGRGVPTAPSGPTRPTGSYRYTVVLAQNMGAFILLGESTGLKNWPRIRDDHYGLKKLMR